MEDPVKSCKNCGGSFEDCDMYCVRGDNGSGAEDFWGESAESIRARYEARVEELERERDEARAEALRILRLCADRPNLDHIPFQPARLEDWFNRIDNDQVEFQEGSEAE